MSAASGGDGLGGDSLLLAFGVGFSYQLGLEEPPQSSKGGREEDGESWMWEVGRWGGRERGKGFVRKLVSPASRWKRQF